MGVEAVIERLQRRGGVTPGNTEKAGGVTSERGLEPAENRQKSGRVTPVTRVTLGTARSEAKPDLDANDLAFLAAEGAYPDNVVDLATIREARTLAGITRQPLECLGDEARCGCGRCYRRRP